jgi:photosystem II stability/assembly factor-like uncharacterized protein
MCVAGKCLDWVVKPKYVSENLYSVWGSSASDVWMVGWNGTILHHDGSSWSTPASPTTHGIETVFGTSASNIWAGGYPGFLLHNDGQKWSKLSSPHVDSNPRSIWIDSTGNKMWIVGGIAGVFYSDNKGATWTQESWKASGMPLAISGTSAADVWAVGQDGSVSHRGATGSWTPSTITVGGKKPYFHDVWGSSPSDYWASASTGDAEIPFLVHYDGSSWSTKSSGSSCPGTLYAIWGSSASNVFAVGGGSGVPGVPGSGCSSIVHFDGAKWYEISTGIKERLFGVWGFSPTDVWAVGDSGTILHLE